MRTEMTFKIKDGPKQIFASGAHLVHPACGAPVLPTGLQHPCHTLQPLLKTGTGSGKVHPEVARPLGTEHGPR